VGESLIVLYRLEQICFAVCIALSKIPSRYNRSVDIQLYRSRSCKKQIRSCVHSSIRYKIISLTLLSTVVGTEVGEFVLTTGEDSVMTAIKMYVQAFLQGLAPVLQLHLGFRANLVRSILYSTEMLSANLFPKSTWSWGSCRE